MEVEHFRLSSHDAANIAPGMNRSFLSEDWKNLISRKHWYNIHDEANDLVNLDIETDIQGYDLDGEIIKAARENARLAGVGKLIHFQQRDVKDLSHPKKYGFVVTNLHMERGLRSGKIFRLFMKLLGKAMMG